MYEKKLHELNMMELKYRFLEFNKTATGDVVVGNLMVIGGGYLLGNTTAGQILKAVGTGKVIRGICRQAIQMEK